MEVQDLEDELGGLQTRINRLTEGLNDMKSDVSRHNAAIAEATTLIEKYKKQMDNVKNNREYDALNKEIQMQELDIKLAEKRIREGDGQLTNKEETLKAAQERYDLRAAALETKKVELEKIIVKTTKDEEKLGKKRKKASKVIEERLLASYNKVRDNYRNGVAVATVSRDSCGGCFNKIPPQVQLEIGTHKKIIACEHCGRILVDDHLLEPAAAK